MEEGQYVSDELGSSDLDVEPCFASNMTFTFDDDNHHDDNFNDNYDKSSIND